MDYNACKEKIVRSLNQKYILRIVLTSGIILLLIYLLISNIKEIKQYEFSFSILNLIISFIFVLAASLILPVIWYLITVNLNCNISFAKSLKARLISEIGKYIPGRIFGYGYLLVHYKGYGKEQLRVLNSAIYELYLSAYSAFLFFTIILLFTSFNILDEFKIGLIAISLIGVISLHPLIFKKISGVFYKIFKKEKIEFEITFKKMFGLLSLYLIYWIVIGIAFFFFVRAFTIVTLMDLPFLAGSFAISTFAGFLVFFLPSGLGAREGLLIYLLVVIMNNRLAIVISIGSRIWLILCDTILFFIALFAHNMHKRTTS